MAEARAPRMIGNCWLTDRCPGVFNVLDDEELTDPDPKRLDLVCSVCHCVQLDVDPGVLQEISTGVLTRNSQVRIS